MKRIALLLALCIAPAAANADTLYVAPPAAAAPGHPLRLGPDHRASQIGDLVNVLFNFSSANTNTQNVNDSKQFNGGLAAGTGLAGIGFLRFPSSLGGQSAFQATKSATGDTSFQSDMMAQVIDVLPSGVLVISGDQALVVNGQRQILHVTGLVRPEDIDSTDTVLSTRLADVQAKFDGNYIGQHVGIIRRILNWLF